MHAHEGMRAAWVQSTSWKSARSITIDQRVLLSGMPEPANLAFAQQRSISIMVLHPPVSRYTDDPNDETECALTGQLVWSRPTLLVRETGRAVFLAAISRQTRGSTAGCGIVASSCDDITLRTVRLAARIGQRRLYATTFS